MTTETEKHITAALSTLIILQLLMLSALFTQTVPHPPLAVAPFAIAPFFAVSLAACTSALILGPSTRAGRVIAALAALLALVSFGPQKYFDAQFSLIWPAVMTGQFAALVILIQTARGPRGQSAAA